MVNFYPQPGKDKSLRICEAFAEGLTRHNVATAMHKNAAAIAKGTAFFYGVVGIERLLHEAVDYLYADNSYFDAARGKHFRVGRNELQPARMLPPDYDRLAALNLEIKPWRRDGRHIVVVMQSEPFMTGVACWPGGVVGWQQHVLETLKARTDRLIVLRHWTSDKVERARTLHQDLQDAWAVVTHMSAAANEAVLAGVPVFVTGPCAALPMGLSDLSSIERPRRPDGRHEWAAGLAGAMWSMDEFKNGTAWRALQA